MRQSAQGNNAPALKIYRLRIPLFVEAGTTTLNQQYFFPETPELKGKTITGISIDIAPPRFGAQYNIAANDTSESGAPAINTAESLSYMYLTLYDENQQIIFDTTPLNLFSNYNSDYPNATGGVKGGKKQIIPVNTKINIKQSYVKGTPGFTLFNSIISFNFYYK